MKINKLWYIYIFTCMYKHAWSDIFRNLVSLSRRSYLWKYCAIISGVGGGCLVATNISKLPADSNTARFPKRYSVIRRQHIYWAYRVLRYVPVKKHNTGKLWQIWRSEDMRQHPKLPDACCRSKVANSKKEIAYYNHVGCSGTDLRRRVWRTIPVPNFVRWLWLAVSP
jgi:hypothetical protein